MPVLVESGPLLLDMTIPIELTNRNDGQGHAWYRTSQARDDIEYTLRNLKLTRTPFDCRVIVRLTRILGKRQSLIDHDSGLRGNSKQLIDALVACGWFHDDKPKHIANVLFQQDDSQRQNGPATRIEVFREGE